MQRDTPLRQGVLTSGRKTASLTDMATPHPAVTSLTVADIARRLSVSEEVVRRTAREGELRGFQIGRRWRFDPAAVEEFVVQRTAPPKETRTAP